MECKDFPAVVGIQRLCFLPPFPQEYLWSPTELAAHIARFPEGQWVVDSDGEVVASSSNVLVSEEIWQKHLNWYETVGGPEFEGHDPQGTTLYGADISVHPGYRRQGIGRLIYEARFALVRSIGLARFGTACRMPDFRNSGFERISDYAAAVAAGGWSDRTLTPLLGMGMTFLGVIEDYMLDEESANAGALLEWMP